MRSLYWKIFISFWVATSFIIITTAWVTGQIAQKSSVTARERLFMDSYANAAIATFESGQSKALKRWLAQSGDSKHMSLFLLSSNGEIIGSQKNIPVQINNVSKNLADDALDEGMFKSGNLIVSHEILSTSGTAYRLAALSEKPLSHFVQLPWAGLTIRLSIAIFFSGLICYLLSLYLTRPLRSLKLAAASIGTGKLHTRVGHLRGHAKDEIAELSDEFDRMAEQLENLVKSKERLLQDISHELRSPLARLNIALELARNKTGTLAVKELQRIELECERLNELIGEILDYARMEQSQNTMVFQKVNITTLLTQIIEDANYENGLHEKRVKTLELTPCHLKANISLLHRAFENVLRNALKYSPEDKPIFVSLTENNHTINMVVEDQGPGIPENQLSKIFNPFYRVDTSREKKTGGYGLGLAIAYQAIKLHGGEITAVNRMKSGLKVTISLPILE